MAWTSIEQIAADLDLSSKPDDYDGLKNELRVKLAELHPDKDGGAFSSPEEEARYNEVSSAYEFVKLACRESTALVPVTQLPAIIKAVRDAQVEPIELQVGRLRAEYREERRLDAHSRYALPRIGSGVFAAICTSLFTFSGALAEHPVLGAIAQNMAFQISLLVLAASAGMFFLLTRVRERRETALADYLMSEGARSQIFDAVRHNMRHRLKGATHRQFSVQNVVDVIQERWGRSRYHSPLRVFLSPFLASRRIKLSTAEKIAQIHLLELEKRGAIRRIETPSIDSLYEFDKQLM